MNGTWGYEHEQLTKILTGKQHDIIDSRNYIQLNRLSVNNCSGNRKVNDRYTVCKMDSFVSLDHYEKMICSGQNI